MKRLLPILALLALTLAYSALPLFLLLGVEIPEMVSNLWETHALKRAADQCSAHQET